MNKRPVCTEKVTGTGEKCTKPAIYYVQWNDCQTAVCGLCARRYIATALHPLRLAERQNLLRKIETETLNIPQAFLDAFTED